MHDVAKAFNMKGMDISDDPMDIRNALESVFEGPLLLNIRTHRKFWHSGAGIDDVNTFDRYMYEMTRLGFEAEKIHEDTKNRVKELWQKRLETQ